MTDIELSQLYYLFHYVRNTWIFAHSLDEETETKLADLFPCLVTPGTSQCYGAELLSQGFHGNCLVGIKRKNREHSGMCIHTGAPGRANYQQKYSSASAHFVLIKQNNADCMSYTE